MSKKISLKSVSFTILWHFPVNATNNLELILGEFAASLKEKFPERDNNYKENTFPFDNFPFDSNYRFFSKEEIYEIIFSKNICSIKTISTNHSWKQMRKNIEFTTSQLLSILNEYTKLDHLHLYLNYENFRPSDSEKVVSLDNLISIGIFNNLSSFSVEHLVLKLDVDGEKHLKLMLKQGHEENVMGIYFDFLSISNLVRPVEVGAVLKWADRAHGDIKKIYMENFV